MLHVFGDTGFEVRRRYVGGVVEVEFALKTSAKVLDRIAERDHSAVSASLESFFKPGSVAVIGASARRGTIGGELFRNVIAADFSGAAYPVNQKGDPVGGVPGYRSIEEIPAPVDLAIVCVPGEQVLAATESALQRRCPCGLRDLGGLRRDRIRGARAPGAAARTRPALRRPPDRPELPRRGVGGVPSERNVRAQRLPGRPHRVLVPERRARAGAARAGRRAGTRTVGVRFDREQGRRLVERPARVLGGRSRDGRRPALPRILRQPTQVRASRRPGGPLEADPRDAQRHEQRRCARSGIAHRRPGRLRRRRRRALPRSRRAARDDSAGAARHRRAAHLAARRPQGTASRSSRTPAVWASSVPTPARRTASCCRN